MLKTATLNRLVNDGAMTLARTLMQMVPYHVPYVEDEPDESRELCKQLGALGLKAFPLNGQKDVTSFLKSPYGMSVSGAVADLRMNGLKNQEIRYSGLDLIVRIAKHQRKMDIPVVIYSRVMGVPGYDECIENSNLHIVGRIHKKIPYETAAKEIKHSFEFALRDQLLPVVKSVVEKSVPKPEKLFEHRGTTVAVADDMITAQMDIDGKPELGIPRWRAILAGLDDEDIGFIHRVSHIEATLISELRSLHQLQESAELPPEDDTIFHELDNRGNQK